MAWCGWAVCWCQCCEQSAPWWRWGYGMERHKLWTANTVAFYQWQFECRDVVPFIRPHHLMFQHDNAWPHVARIWTQFLEAENVPVLPWHAYAADVAPCACLGCSGSACTTLCSSSRQYPSTSHSHCRVGQHSTQCCQISDFVAIFSEYSDPSSDTFFKKRLVTNLATISGVIGDFCRLWRECTYRSYSSQRATGAAVGPTPVPKHSQAAQYSRSNPSQLQPEQEMLTPPPSRLQMNHACGKPPLADPALTYMIFFSLPELGPD